MFADLRSARPSSARNSSTALPSGRSSSSGISTTGLQAPLTSRCVGRRAERPPLPAVMTIEAALASDAPLLFDGPSPGIAVPVGGGATSVKDPRPNVLYEFGYRNGDADAVLAASDHVFEDRFAFSRLGRRRREGTRSRTASR